jgi:hypothetical protein
MTTYEKDFYAWSKEQSSLLREKEYTKLDIENLIEEIESLGRSERRTLISHLIIYFQHILKTQFQPEYDCKSWKDSIRKSLYQAEDTLKDNPSLKSQLVEILDRAYHNSRFLAMSETGLPEETFPVKRYFQIQDVFKDIEDKYKE